MAHVHMNHAGNVQVQIINASEYLPGLFMLLLICLPTNSKMIQGKNLYNWPGQEDQMGKGAMSKEILMV